LSLRLFPQGLKFIPRIPKDRKQMILISSVLVLLTAVIIAAILIGIIKTISSGKDGQTVEHTMMVNNQERVSESNDLVYSFKKGKLAVRTTLGTTINILCSDIPIYWAE
ncbi:hypothetical protein E2320_007091, partial [Naja naja]